MDVRAACLDRQREIERAGDADGGGTVRIEELRIHEVEWCLGVQMADQRQRRARDRAGVQPPADLGEESETRTVDRNSVLDPAGRRSRQNSIAARQKRVGKRRQADGIYDGYVPIGLALQGFQRAGHERPEARIRCIREECRERQDARHRQSFRTSISATAIQAGSFTTSCFWP